MVIIMVGCGMDKPTSQPMSQTTFKLGTVVSITIYDSEDEAVFETLFERMQLIEDKMSRTISTSEVSRINDYSQNHNLEDILEIDPEVYEVIRTAVEFGEMSDGRFDITLAPVVALWGIGTEQEGIPDRDLIEKALLTVGPDKLMVLENNRIALAKGTTIDLGGIAKGYAADEIEHALKDMGINKAIINLGGNVKVMGKKEENMPFKIGIQDPLAERNDYLGILSAEDKTIVTSGDYEKYFEVDGMRYHHIFDPTTGYPYNTDVASVTVIGDKSIIADVMSTILYLMDVDEGLELVNSIEGIDCIYITRDQSVYLSNGSIRETFELTNIAYQLKN